MKIPKKIQFKKLSVKQKVLFSLLLLTVLVLYYTGIRNANASVIIQTGQKQDSGLGWTYTFEDNMLIMEYTYHYVSSATLSYETTGTIWTKEKSGGYPDEIKNNVREYAITAVKQDNMPTGKNVYKYDSVGNGKSYSKITYPAEAIIDLIKSVYEIEELEPDYPYEVYLSEVYCLKERDTISDPWVVNYSKKYKNIDDIRKAVGWSDETYEGFAQYYDVPITFKLAGAKLDIVYVDIKDSDKELKTAQEEVANVAVGSTKSIIYETNEIIKDGNKYTYKGIQLVHKDDSASNSWENRTGDYLFNPTKEGKYTLYVGFEVVHEHEWSIQYDIDGHWYECFDCGEKTEKHEHIMVEAGNSASDMVFVCECVEHPECEYTYTVHNHDWVIVYDSNHHWYECSNCKETMEKHEHNMVETSSTAGDMVFICECAEHPECDYTYMIHEHIWIITYDSDKHWYECSNEKCNEISEKHEHQMVESKETNVEGDTILVCDCKEHPECDYTESLHVHDWEIVYNSRYHWFVCLKCNQKLENHLHIMVETDKMDEKGNRIRECECSDHPECDYTDTVHVCTFVWGGKDEESHWYICKNCGKKSDKHAHVMVKTSEVDEKGNVIRTCECSDHPECDHTDAIHQHEYLKWRPDAREQDYYDPEWDYKEQGYVYDPDIYHWQYCAYNSCTSTRGKARHIAGEYVNGGEGFFVQRCTECNWILDRKNVTVSLSINPNGGTFSDGSKDTILLTDSLEYDTLTNLGKLGPEYWVTFEEGYSFSGFYIVEPGESACFYYPDHETRTCLADPKYFYPAANGNGFWSNLKKSYILYAQKSAAEYTVRYNANGGTGIMYDRVYKVGVEFTLSPNAFQYINNITYNSGNVSSVVETTLDNTKVWSDFTGWGTSPNGPVAYVDKQSVVNLKKGAGIVNLYAIWNHGTIILPNATATDGGSKLSGWITEDGTFISVLNESGNFKAVSYTLKGGDETLTAVWVPNQYKVSFDSAGGTMCVPITVTYKKPYSYNNTGLPTTSKTGYTFRGWVYKPMMETITNSSIVLYPMDHILTATWKVNDVTVYLDYTFHFEQTAQNPNKNSAGFSNLTSFTNEIDKMVLEYDSYYGALPLPTMDGYTFAGWYMEKDINGNGCGHQSCLLTETGSRVTNMNSHTLYARWVKEQYRVDLDYNYDYSVWED